MPEFIGVTARAWARCEGRKTHGPPSLRTAVGSLPLLFQSPILYRRFSTSPAFRTLLRQERSHKMRAGDELLCGYKERVRARLQELMVQEGYIPSHPLVSATSLHLNLSTASEVASNYGAPNNAVSYYQGCDLFYRVPQRAATPLSECGDSPRPKTTTITL